MNKRIQKYGAMLFDYMFITILLNISIILVIPFIPIVIGVTKYFTTAHEEKSLSVIFHTIKSNFKIILQITLFMIVLFSAPLINLYVLKTNTNTITIVIDIISYIIMFIGLIIFLHMPVIIGYMDITFKELIHNSIMLSFGNLINFFTNIGIAILFVYLITQSYLVLILGIPFAIQLIARLSYNSLIIIKERIK